MNPWARIEALQRQYEQQLAYLRVECRKLGGAAPRQIITSGVWRCSYRPPGYRRVLHIRGNSPESLLAALEATVRAYKRRRSASDGLPGDASDGAAA